MTPDLIKDLLILTVNDPRAAARRILAMQLAWKTMLLLFALVCIIAAIIGYVVSLATVGLGNEIFSPIGAVMLVAAGGVVSAWIIGFGGRLFGGTGTFRDMFLLGIWSQFIQILVSIVSIIATVFSSGLSQLVDFASVGFTFWLLVNFTLVAHGFKSRATVAMGIFGVTFVLIFVVSILANMFGLLPVIPAVGA